MLRSIIYDLAYYRYDIRPPGRNLYAPGEAFSTPGRATGIRKYELRIRIRILSVHFCGLRLLNFFYNHSFLL
jgi:hypothetical protein